MTAATILLSLFAVAVSAATVVVNVRRRRESRRFYAELVATVAELRPGALVEMPDGTTGRASVKP